MVRLKSRVRGCTLQLHPPFRKALGSVLTTLTGGVVAKRPHSAMGSRPPGTPGGQASVTWRANDELRALLTTGTAAGAGSFTGVADTVAVRVTLLKVRVEWAVVRLV